MLCDRARADEPAAPAAARRALARPRAADRAADLRHHRRPQRAQKLTVFLVEQNAFHALKLAHRGYVMVNGLITMSGTGRSCWNGRRSAPPTSKAAGRKRRRMTAMMDLNPLLHHLLYEEDSLRRLPPGHHRPRRRRGLADRPGHRRHLAAVVACCRATCSSSAATVRFFHYALFGRHVLSLHYYAVDTRSACFSGFWAFG